MTTEQQEMLYIATVAKESGLRRVEIDPNDLIALLHRVRDLEARVEEMRRRHEPTMSEQIEDMDDRAYARGG